MVTCITLLITHASSNKNYYYVLQLHILCPLEYSKCINNYCSQHCLKKYKYLHMMDIINYIIIMTFNASGHHPRLLSCTRCNVWWWCVWSHNMHVVDQREYNYNYNSTDQSIVSCLCFEWSVKPIKCMCSLVTMYKMYMLWGLLVDTHVHVHMYAYNRLDGVCQKHLLVLCMWQRDELWKGGCVCSHWIFTSIKFWFILVEQK